MEYEYVEYTKELKEMLENIFTDSFMQQNSKFENFENFQFSSAVFVNWDSDQLIYVKSVFDGFVAESTRFKTWEEMVKAGADLSFNS